MLIAYIIVGVVIVIIGFVIMCFMFGDGAIDEPETFVEGLRIVSMFTAASWLVAILWPVLLVAAVPTLIIYGAWRLAVEGVKLRAEIKKESASV